MATPLSADRLLAVLRAEGVRVAEHAGWRSHNRNEAGPWGPVNGVLIHHTAGSNSLDAVWRGRSDLPGPLCHTHLAKNATATMISAGRSNHAGKAAKNAFNALLNESSTHPRPSVATGTVDGNQHLYGIEIENRGDGKDPYPAVQYDAAVRWAAALCRAHGWSADSVAGHKETSIEGKIDPSFSMGGFRVAVAERLKHPASWSPGSSTTKPPKENDDMTTARQTNDAVWDLDVLPAPPSASTSKTNKTWKAASYLKELYELLLKVRAEQTAQSARLDAIEKKVNS
ncbi:N-acetylmuramoyl-L-alanine amidase [Streptomyces sp. SCSIO ZS0520]|uniref:peptidoglycan recognition protein family protein n=1 Tax=Streptomyces sp. SCSIO ZS0520 TaxID=2892996 RepID=UPI0021D9005C|nr:N-acetylmuramoyl-L-alanine amidase [Streptomyces sp. SCSIO ZS0520]